MSTFSGLNTAYTGLLSAKQGFDVVGQNVANADTVGYTRQRLTTSATAPLASTGMFSNGIRPGQGVTFDGIARLGNSTLDAQVRTTAGSVGYTAVRANALSNLETSLNEPGANGIASQLSDFWAAWGDLSNDVGESAPAGLLLSSAKTLASTIAAGHQSVSNQWGAVRSDLSGMVTEVNSAAAQVADLNGRIRSTLNAGESANELLDARTLLTTTLAALTGGTVRELPNGTVDVLVGGNPLVTGTTAQELVLTGSASLAGAAGTPVQIEWARRPGVAVAVDGGEIAGSLAVLAPTTPAGTGGALAEAAADYDALATQLVTQVNAVHQTGAAADGTTGHDFFQLSAGGSPAQGITVIPTTAAEIASREPGTGGLNGSIAAAISKIGTQADAPDKLWKSTVASIAVLSKTALTQAKLADIASVAAVNNQLSSAAVDLDEENVSLLTYQHAYQGAARVITAIDEMLDTLINRTGIVGR